MRRILFYALRPGGMALCAWAIWLVLNRPHLKKECQDLSFEGDTVTVHVQIEGAAEWDTIPARIFTGLDSAQTTCLARRDTLVRYLRFHLKSRPAAREWMAGRKDG